MPLWSNSPVFCSNADRLTADRILGAGTTRFGLWGEQLASWGRLYRSPAAVRRYQKDAFFRLVRHAGRKVPYYQRLFQVAGLSSRQLHELSDNTLIPITEKADLQSVPLTDRLSNDVRLSDCRIHETSGSMGEPIRIARTIDEDVRLFGRRLRVQVLSGLRPWRRRVIIGASPRAFLPHRLGLFPVTGLPLEFTARETVEQLEIRRPHLLKGPPSALEQLLDEYPDRMSSLGLKTVFVGAERLSRQTRQRLEQICRCPVIEFYGAAECNLIAWQCVRCGQYHTCDDGVMVEVLRDGREAEPGEVGEVVITALHSFAMPFIRYRVGDAVRLPRTPVPCSIGFGTIESIEGRTVEYLKFTGGPKISPYTLMDELDPIEDVARYEAEQTGPQSLLIRFKPLSASRVLELAELIRGRCGNILPSDVEVRVQAVERFVLTPGEKRRFIRSRQANSVDPR